MPVPHAMLVVEGTQDAQCVGCLLAPAKFKRITNSDQLPQEWRVLIPTTFPKAGLGINQPHAVPHFYISEAGTLIAMIIAGSDSQLASALGVWAMIFLTVTIVGASLLLGKKLGALFR